MDDTSTRKSSCIPASASSSANVPWIFGASTPAAVCAVFNCVNPRPGTPAAWNTPWIVPNRSTACPTTPRTCSRSAMSAATISTSAPASSSAITFRIFSRSESSMDRPESFPRLPHDSPHLFPVGYVGRHYQYLRPCLLQRHHLPDLFPHPLLSP